ncbi:MAG: hypothetical protein KO206_06755 [Methanomicrobiaceae archaeon]|uniref:Transcription factor Pcc1 n=1 Tax=hydrocarbon metagenome TaxID=938273 RepID=A0A0W8FI25_9ZZZZ|nr:hypothetical protein [Methanomicrobiaceae archaeon]MDD5418572.1 KEOPS complex subunit Pcc1 [Methanomicrobiaceae archaeon]
MKYRATFRFTADSARSLYLSVCQEAGDVGGRSTAAVSLEGDRTLVLTVGAADLPSLRAALNSWLRLINIAREMQDLIGAPAADPGGR